MSVNLCPCMPLQKGSQLLAIIDAVISTVNLGLLIVAFIGVMILTEKEKINLNERERSIALGVIGLGILISFLQILMALRLYFGAKNRDRKNVKIWLIASTISVAISFISLIVNSSAGEINGLYIVATLATVLYKIYEIFVVFAFFKKSMGQLSPSSYRESQSVSGIENQNENVPSTSIALATISQPQLYHPRLPQPRTQYQVYATQVSLGPPPASEIATQNHDANEQSLC